MFDIHPEWFGRNGHPGTTSFRFGPMNSGKTRDTVRVRDEKNHDGGNVASINHSSNSRDGASLAVDGQSHGAAIQASCVAEIKESLEFTVRKIFSRRIEDQGKDGRITINGITHRKYRPLVAVAIDEVNLYALNSHDAEELIDFLKWSRKVGLDVYSSGLLYDFRGEYFGHIRAIIPHIDHLIPVTARCKAVHDGTQCGDTAYNSQRVWSRDFLETQKLGMVAEAMELYDFADKEGKIISDKYVAAPFFDKTLRIEEAQDGRVKYFPVCHDCFTVPFKKEVDAVYQAVVHKPQTGKELMGLLDSPRLTGAILHFLQGESLGDGNYLTGSQLIRQREGLLEAVPFYKTSVGTFESRS